MFNILCDALLNWLNHIGQTITSFFFNCQEIFQIFSIELCEVLIQKWFAVDQCHNIYYDIILGNTMAVIKPISLKD